MSALMKRPQPMETSSPFAFVPRTVFIDAKSMPDNAHPIGGMMTALTNVLTSAPSETPMMTPMARASALDLVRKALKPAIVSGSVLDDLRQVLRLGDPAGDLGFARDAPDDPGPGRDDLLEGDGQVRRVALGQLRRGVHARRLEQVRILGSDARDAHEVDVVDPFQDQLAADARRVLERLPTGRVRAPLEQLVGRRDPGRRELAGLHVADPLDL